MPRVAVPLSRGNKVSKNSDGSTLDTGVNPEGIENTLTITSRRLAIEWTRGIIPNWILPNQTLKR